MTKKKTEEEKKATNGSKIVHYEVESDVPVPQIMQGRSKYPFEILGEGQSFLVTCTAAKVKAMRSNLTSAAKRVEKKTGAKFLCVIRTKKVDGEDGVRCWCVDDGHAREPAEVTAPTEEQMQVASLGPPEVPPEDEQAQDDSSQDFKEAVKSDNSFSALLDEPSAETAGVE